MQNNNHKFMSLKGLIIRNFKGVEDFKLAAGDRDVMVYGDNGTGKTTIGDAVSWLLFDKDSNGQSKFEIKPLNSDGSYKDKVESEVEATFTCGSDVVLRKTYKERWVKKRGSVAKEMTGHTTEYFVDDVPVKMKDYKAKVAEIAANEDLFRLLTLPSFFSEKMHWQKRRELLLDICGDLTDEAVITSVPELAELPAILDGKTCDDYKKIVAASRKKINTDIEGIPGRIDEVDRGKPELETANVSSLPGVIAKLRSDLDEKNQEIATTKAGGRAAELNKDLAGVEASIQGVKTSHQETVSTFAGGMRETLADEKDKLSELNRAVTSATTNLTAAEGWVTGQDKILERLRTDWAVIDGEVFTEEVCHACGQHLPGDQVEAALAKFNENRAARLEENNTQGKEAAEALKQHTKAVAEHKETISSLGKEVEEKGADIKTLAKRIADNSTAAPELETLPEYIELTTKKEQLEKEIAGEGEGNGEALEKLNAEKKVTEKAIKDNEHKISLVEQVTLADRRIEELNKKEKVLAEKYEELERHLYLIETFIRAKVSMLEGRINENFSMVNFKLFAEQVNGGLQEICEVTVDGVPYGSLNNGARVASGIDIINTISRHHNFHPMIFVDNRESVTSLPETEAQMINLIVSEGDKELRIANQ